MVNIKQSKRSLKYLAILNYLKLNNALVYFVLILISPCTFADSFKFNTYNNHGVIGLVNLPTARFYNESVHGITLYDGTPDQKITLTSHPYDWLESSFFYTNLQNKPYCEQTFDPVCSQDYKDKGFNFKLKLKEEGVLPALAIGFNDIAGTGYYSSEYIVGSYGIDNLDFHFGVGWGNLSGSSLSFKNPLIYIDDQFAERPLSGEGQGGSFDLKRYFSSKKIAPFYGMSYVVNDKLLFKFEKDTTLTPGKINYENSKSDYSYGLDYSINDNFLLGISYERGSYFSLKFVYKNNPVESRKKFKYQAAEITQYDNKYDKLIKNIENNGIGVNKIIETSNSIGIELTQFIHPNLNIVEDVIQTAVTDAGIEKDVKKDLRIANLRAISEYDEEFEKEARIIYERKKRSNFRTNTNFTFRPFLASREEFFKGALMLENNTEYIIADNFFFSSNLKYSLADNFDDLYIPPVNTYPAQVRSDVKEYLKNFNKGIIIGRAQFDYHITPKKNNHLMFTAGILEDMFSGYGMEYLHFKNDTNYAVGFEVFDVVKRDYSNRFGTLDYRNTTIAGNFYYRNYNVIPFDAKLSVGEYLAGDKGVTLEFSRAYENGVEFGVFASFTDVSSKQFGEGSFDKGIFFNVPVYGNLINYTWRPYTKDPGARLVRKHTLYDLLVKFRPIN